MVETFATFFGQTLSASVAEYSVRILIGAILTGGIVLLTASVTHHRYHFTKKTFYTLLSGITVATTAALVIVHVMAMTSSDQSSIEKRQARFVISVCEQQFPILSNDFLSSASGTARQKIFEDGRFEYLGYVTDPARDVSLGSFFQAFGGSINASLITLPYPESVESRLANSAGLAQFIKTNPLGERYLEIQSGSACDIFPSMVSVFVYKYSEATNSYTKTRLTQPESYIVSTQPVKTMDCVVVIYGHPAEDTNLRCGDYPDADRVSRESGSEAELL